MPQLVAYATIVVWLLGLSWKASAQEAHRDLFLLNLLHEGFFLIFLFGAIAVHGEMSATVILTMSFTLLIWLLVAVGLRIRTIVRDDEQAEDFNQFLRDQMKDMTRHGRRWRCYIGLHRWQPHAVLDHLCICSRCTKIAQHRWRGAGCSRCGATPVQS